MKPIRLIPWQSPFIPALANFLLSPEGPGLEDTVIVFPHSRPRRYLQDHLLQSDAVTKPCFLPRCFSFEQFTALLADGLRPQPARPAGRLDQAGLLLDIVQELQLAGQGQLALLPSDPEAFLPWGFRLAGLLEELLRQNVRAADLTLVQDEVLPWAGALLEQLGTIAGSYEQGLKERGLTTPGLDCRMVLGDLDQALSLLGDAPVVSAGFYGLTGGERTVFEALRDQGRLEVVWHGDPALAGDLSQAHPTAVHPSEAEHLDWLRDWRVRAELLEEPQDGPEPEISFVEGFDLHSQLTGLKKELDRQPGGRETAIVLPDASALVPVLYHLPGTDVNISMGYPLARSGLQQLLEAVLAAQENAKRDQDGVRYHWRDLIALLRHPYLRMLAAPQESIVAQDDQPEIETRPDLRPLLRAWEAQVRSGEKFQDPEAVAPVYGEGMLEGVERESGDALRADVTALFLRGFEDIATCADLARSLARLTDLLLTRGRGQWRNHLLDAELLARLSTSLIPALGSGTLAARPFSRSALFAILRQMVAAERVSFEPEPLHGLQVLGMLESRLLTFDTLYVLDAVEDKLPGASRPDPLLPDPLRALAGLPDSRRRDHVAAYNFTRLLMGAHRAVLLYQAGVTPGLFDSKSVRSRFVEQLLWQEEKARGELIRPGEEPLAMVHYAAAPLPRPRPGLMRTPAMDQAVRQWLTRGPAPVTALDAYLKCPVQFFYTRIARLAPLMEVGEDGDPAELGEAVHGALERYYRPRLNRRLDPDLLDREELVRLYVEELENTDFFRQVPFEVRTGLLAVGRHRLSAFLDHQPRTTVTELEASLEAAMDVQGLGVRLKGKMDRLDRRESPTDEGDDGVVILDYKTGHLPRPRRDFWEDEVLHGRMDAWTPASGPDADLLFEAAQASGGVQLPAYLWLYAMERGETPLDAGWVELRDKGREVLLLGHKRTMEEREQAVGRTAPGLIAFVLRHLLLSPEFPARQDRLCDYCEVRGLCGL